MKHVTKTIIATLLFAGSFLSANADSVQVTNSNIMFLYETVADIPTPKENLAKIMSKDYREAPDEFSAYDLFQKIEPVIDKKIEEAAAVETIHVAIGDNLEKYDFQRKGFDTGISDSTFLRMDSSYALMFTDADALAFLDVPMEEARELSGALRHSRKIAIRIEGTVDRAEEKDLNYRPSKVIYLNPTRLVITLEDGRVIGEKVIE